MDLGRYGVTPDAQLSVDVAFCDEVLRIGVEHGRIPTETRAELEKVFGWATGRLAEEVVNQKEHPDALLRLLGKLSYLDTLCLLAENLPQTKPENLRGIWRYRRLFRGPEDEDGVVTYRKGVRIQASPKL